MNIINILLFTLDLLILNIRWTLRKKTIFLKEILIFPFEFIISIDENKEKNTIYINTN